MGVEPTGVAPGFSPTFIDKMLRTDNHFDGVVCTDWCITHNVEGMKHGGKPWGVEDKSVVEHHYLALMAGCDQFGGNNEKAPVLEAFDLMSQRHGAEWADARIRKSAERLLLNMFRIGLFEMPYLDVDTTVAKVGCKGFSDVGFDTQLKSIIMLKNGKSVLPVDSKKSVYIPNRTVPAYSGYWEEQNEEKTVTPLSDKIISKYFKHAATPAEADFAIVFIDSPFGCYGYDYSKLATSTDAYLPISLQYKPYTATAAREKTIAGENRSYKGRSATVANSTDYNLVRDVRAAIGNKPLVVVVNTTNPFVISEIEPLADAILLTFDVQNQAALEIISGRPEPSALLPFVMPADMATVEQQAEDTPFDMIPYKDAAGNEYIFGYGLNWSGIIRDARTEKYGITKSQLNPAPQAAAE